MRYECIAKCIELDRDNTPHCVEFVTNELELMELKNKECPVGNTPKWVRKEYSKLRQLEEEMTPGECVDEIISALECLYTEQGGIKLPNGLSKYADSISIALRQAKLLKTKL